MGLGWRRWLVLLAGGAAVVVLSWYTMWGLVVEVLCTLWLLDRWEWLMAPVMSPAPRPVPPQPMPILEPLEACPGCGHIGAHETWLIPDRGMWVHTCWECGYKWPQGSYPR